MRAEVLVPFLGVVVASIALIFTATQVYLNGQQLRTNTDQLHQNTEVNRGNFWLKLEEMSRHYDEVHLKLRPGGVWTGLDKQGRYKGPKEDDPSEWAEVEDYMGYFEHSKIMLDRGLIDAPTFKKIFAYRLRNIVANPVIVKGKLIKNGWGWTDFIKLLRELGIGINLSGANLSGADLAGAFLRETKLIDANLSGASLQGANLSGANLQGANLSDADLSNAKVTDEQLAKAKSLQGALMPDGSKHP